jgi:hypothetical protein
MGNPEAPFPEVSAIFTVNMGSENTVGIENCENRVY